MVNSCEKHGLFLHREAGEGSIAERSLPCSAEWYHVARPEWKYQQEAKMLWEKQAGFQKSSSQTGASLCIHEFSCFEKGLQTS
jgi:hypothetical protein